MASAAAPACTVPPPTAEPLDTPRLASLLYLELRRIARWRLAGERARHSLQPTGLTHEAVLRLLGDPSSLHWDSRGHFVAAVSQAMRRIIVEEGRRRNSQKRGGRFVRHDIALAQVADDEDWSETLAVDDLLEQLAAENGEAARVVELRYFAGLTEPETAVLLGMSRRTVNRRWQFARAWLRHALGPTRDNPASHDAGAGRRRLPR